MRQRPETPAHLGAWDYLNHLWREVMSDSSGRLFNILHPAPVTYNNIGVGNDKVFTVPANRLWIVRWIHLGLTTTATLGNRTPVVDYRDAGDGVIFRLIHPQQYTENTTNVYYEFFPGAARETALMGINLGPLPPVSCLPAGYDVRIYDNDNRDVNDTFAVYLMVTEIETP